MHENGVYTYSPEDSAEQPLDCVMRDLVVAGGTNAASDTSKEFPSLEACMQRKESLAEEEWSMHTILDTPDAEMVGSSLHRADQDDSTGFAQGRALSIQGKSRGEHHTVAGALFHTSGEGVLGSKTDDSLARAENVCDALPVGGVEEQRGQDRGRGQDKGVLHGETLVMEHQSGELSVEGGRKGQRGGHDSDCWAEEGRGGREFLDVYFHESNHMAIDSGRVRELSRAETLGGDCRAFEGDAMSEGSRVARGLSISHAETDQSSHKLSKSDRFIESAKGRDDADHDPFHDSRVAEGVCTDSVTSDQSTKRLLEYSSVVTCSQEAFPENVYRHALDGQPQTGPGSAHGTLAAAKDSNLTISSMGIFFTEGT